LDLTIKNFKCHSHHQTDIIINRSSIKLLIVEKTSYGHGKLHIKFKKIQFWYNKDEEKLVLSMPDNNLYYSIVSISDSKLFQATLVARQSIFKHHDLEWISKQISQASH